MMVRDLAEHPITVDECIEAVEKASLDADTGAIGDMHPLILRRASYMLSRVKNQENALNAAHDLITAQVAEIERLKRSAGELDEPG